MSDRQGIPKKALIDCKNGYVSTLQMAVLGVVIVIGIQALMWELAPDRPEYNTETSYEIWDAQAPIGHFWVNEHGSFSGNVIFVSGKLQGDLQESYIVKYLDNGELKTKMFSSTDSHVHVFLTDQLDNMSYVVNETYGKGNIGSTHLMDTNYYIYLPDPKLMNTTQENEVII